MARIRGRQRNALREICGKKIEGAQPHRTPSSI